ncbi:MAG TPA: family 1 glycosylhydrolase [Flavisolibacter sp.]|nr:family 1 glycosylhydrolase [Flavisolibacter sp.]
MSTDKPYYNPEIWGGIECTINRVKNNFFDQTEYSGHYNRPEDLDAIAALNIKKIRYPVLWEKHQPRIDSIIDWSWTEKQLGALRGKNIEIIAGLVHHGSGPFFTNLADPHFPELLAAYAKKVAEKFPWLEYYTPVNEPLTTARFSGLYGIWYPHHNKPLSFLKMLLNQLKGTVLAMQEIRKINPNAKLLQTEDLGKAYSTRTLKYQADFENERRWLTFDILTGAFNKGSKLWKYFKDHGIEEKDLIFFHENPCTPDIFGFNHYVTSERYLDERLNLYPQSTYGGNGKTRYADIEAVRVELSEETGIKVLLKEAWDRFHQPIAVTEVHLHCYREEQLRWFNYIHQSAVELIKEGVDIKAITSWALLGSYGWSKLLTQPGGEYEPGAFDLRSGYPRPTALARHIAELNSENITSHPLSSEAGWWERNSRFTYTPAIRQVHNKKNNQTIAPVLIFGKNGTLGKAFAKVCEERYISYKLLSRQDCDITKKEQVNSIIEEYKPWALINAAGYVRVDDAEKESDKCFAENSEGPFNLAIACNQNNIQLVTFSSDLVFDGKKKIPYTEKNIPSPLNIYGKSKLQCEELVMKEDPNALIIRTSAFFSPWDEYNFVHYVKNALSRYEEIKVARDLVISPTYVPDLVNVALDILIDKEKGIWHLANKGALSWCDLAFEIADRFDLDKNLIQAVSSSEMGYIAKRPAYSVLGSEKGHLLPTLETALNSYVDSHTKVNRKVA